jgi:hypothetical protein
MWLSLYACIEERRVERSWDQDTFLARNKSRLKVEKRTKENSRGSNT